MCGIVGYAGKRQASQVLLDGLEKLEYRGYDSAGLCVHGAEGLRIEKTKGRLAALREKTLDGRSLPGTVGIGHTRWATHGAPSDLNSHPHLSDSGKIAVVHNGIIENEGRLRRELEEKGLRFRSQTDTEVISNLIGWYYSRSGEFLESVRRAMARLEGSFALGILCEDLPGTVVAVKKDSPLIFGLGEGEHILASDVTAILPYTRQVVYLEDGDLAVFDGIHVSFLDAAGERIEKQTETVNWEAASAEKGGFDHFMRKEISEQPKAVRNTVSPRIRGSKVVIEELELTAEELRKLHRICFVACGSAYYVAMLAKYGVEKLCRIPAEAAMASEFRYSDPVVEENSLVVVISQSGETADTLAALKEAKRRGAKTLAIVNVVGSAIAKTADATLYTWAGPEIAVATTKALSAQLAAVQLLILDMAQKLGTMSELACREAVAALERLPEVMERMLQQDNIAPIQAAADRYCGRHHAFYVGRNTDSGICMEGSLKLKEVAYLHSEAYPAGELKHGPIALIEEGTLVVALATETELFDKTMANIREVKARGADVLCVTVEELAQKAAEAADRVLTVPTVYPMFRANLSVIPLQLFAYYVAINRGCDVDKPRNLAKSVTVE